MEVEDEELEQLLEEIPQAMERTAERDRQNRAEDASVNEEGTCMVRSHSVQSMQEIFEAFRPKAEYEYPNKDSLQSTNAGLSDCIVDRDNFASLQLPSKGLGAREQHVEFVRRDAAADTSLAMMFSKLKLQVGAPMQSSPLPLHRAEVSSDMPNQVSSTWAVNASSVGSTLKHVSEDTHATRVKHLFGVRLNGDFGHVSGQTLGLPRRVSLPPPQSNTGNNFFHREANVLDPDVNCVDQVFEAPMVPDWSLNHRVPDPSFNKARFVPSCFLNLKDGWQDHSILVADHCTQFGKLNWKQDNERACHPKDVVTVDYCDGTPASVSGSGHGYSSLTDSGMYSHLSCGHSFRRTLANSYVDNFCTYCTQDICCSKGYVCSAVQDKVRVLATNKGHQVSSAPLSSGLLKSPTAATFANEKALIRKLPRKSTRVAMSVASPGVRYCLTDVTSVSRENWRGNQPSTTLYRNSLKQENLMPAALMPLEAYHVTEEMQQIPLHTWNSLADAEGCILAVAKDQHGCRFLQRKFDDGSPEDIQRIFNEVKDNVVDLMVDPFGNYLVQKLLEVCTDDQKLDLLRSVINNGGLVNVSLNTHGTRAVQKLVETLHSLEHVALVTASLRPGLVTLMNDLNGNHVIQRCLQHLSNEDNEFILKAAAHNCVEIASHRHGCCVLQRCIDYSAGPARQKLIWEIASNSLQLAQDSFGNYVVQYILELGLPWAIEEVINRLVEHYVPLSMQKFSSNVVERCLGLSGEESKACIIQELITSSQFLDLLQGPYSNYVIQSALTFSKGNLHSALVEAIHPHVHRLRNNPYGKRILSRRNFKKN